MAPHLARGRNSQGDFLRLAVLANWMRGFSKGKGFP